MPRIKRSNEIMKVEKCLDASSFNVASNNEPLIRLSASTRKKRYRYMGENKGDVITNSSNKKCLYNNSVVGLVAGIYGETSKIYLKMCNGEKVSELIKSDIRKSKKNSDTNINGKKQLYVLCKERELDICFEKLIEQEIINV